MKKLVTVIVLALCVVIGFTMLTACGGEKEILVVSRESGSGTRDAFDGLIKNKAGDSLAKLADGTARDGLVSTANLQSSTGNVMTKVSSTKTGIGYISLGSVNDTIKTLKVNGVEATSANVLNGTYNLQRPFVMMTNKDVALTSATEDFMKYLKSSQAQKVVKDNKFVEQVSEVAYTAPTSALSGTIIIKGSTSVDPLMDKLIANYKTLGGETVSSIEFSKDAQGSSQGISSAKADTAGNVIGMSSSKMKDADKPSLNYFSVALDAVAIIVNKTNAIENLTIEQLYEIYTGAIKKFSEIV